MSRYYVYLLPAAFIAVILLIVTGQFKSNKSIDQLRKSNLGLLEELNTRNQLQQLKTRVLRLESRGRGIVISGNPFDSSLVEADVRLIYETLDSLAPLQMDRELRADLRKLRVLSDRKILFTREILNGFTQYGKTYAEQLISTDKGTQLTDSIRFFADKIAVKHEQSITLLIQQAERDASRARAFSTLLALIAAVAALMTFLFSIYRLTQQQRLIEQLNVSEQKLREAALLKERFLANMSHEIRTPMNVMLGFTDLLEHQQMDAAARTYLARIRTAGESLLGLLNDILDLSKMEAGMLQLQVIPFRMRELVSNVTAMFRAKADAKGLLLDFRLEPDVPDLLVGDPQRLQQILMNLIGNALKFTDSGQVFTTIKKVSGNENQCILHIDILDTGIGMAKEIQDQIFDRFVQANTEVSRVYGGTGLGLSIVKDLVHLQKGRIKVQSEQGKGTTFSVFLPFQLSDSLPVEQPAPPVHTSIFREPTLEGTHWLITEDNELNQLLMGHILQNNNIRFDIASNGKEAIEKLRDRPYDLILMDLQMPVMDGYETTREIRKILQLDTPIIAISAHAINREREQCLEAGMNDYLSKPIKANILIGKALQLLVNNQQPAQNTLIDLRYLREVSVRDAQYERLVTQQFLEMLPADLLRMRYAYLKSDPQYRKIAHDLKTTISVMGLNPLMDQWLEEIEQGIEDPQRFYVCYHQLKEISKLAVEEATDFLHSLDK
jgi:signal transduction histidine kinase/CheY-like chemotaxis protein